MTANSDALEKFFTRDLSVRVAAARTTALVSEMQNLHDARPVATIALGRAITGAVLMASHLREGQRVALEFRGDGPLGGLYAEGSFEGEVRGYATNPQAFAVTGDGRPDIGSAVGKGTLAVTRSQPFEKAPHTGLVAITDGEIGTDIAFYYLQSHQVPSVVALSVSLANDGSVAAAGGLILEAMPGASDTLLAELETLAKKAGALSQHLLAGEELETIVSRYVHNSPLTKVLHPHPLKYSCRCSRERVDRSLRLLGKSALEEMRDKGDDTSVTCHFCGRVYTVTVAEVGQMLLED